VVQAAAHWACTPATFLLVHEGAGPDCVGLVILCPEDRVLTACGDPSALQGSQNRMLHGPALVFGKGLAVWLFPCQAVEVWAAVLTSDSDCAASATFHVLVACSPHDAAPAGYAWTRQAAIAAARPEAAAWLLAVADAVTAVRRMPEAVPAFAPWTARSSSSPSMAQLWQCACEANEALQRYCDSLAGQVGLPAGQPCLFAD
jgi:hypothetical protein